MRKRIKKLINQDISTTPDKVKFQDTLCPSMGIFSLYRI